MLRHRIGKAVTVRSLSCVLVRVHCTSITLAGGGGSEPTHAHMGDGSMGNAAQILWRQDAFLAFM